jgi:CheY-like chemotaxis protein
MDDPVTEQADLKPILYVEDREDDAFFMFRACAMAGIRQPLQAVPNGAQAIAYLAGTGLFADRDRYPMPCLVLLDLHMPGTSGFEVLSWIRSRAELASLPVLVFTSSSLPHDIEQSTALGANGYLIKPLNLKQLVEMVNGLKDYWLEFDPRRHRNGVTVS